MIDPRWYDDDPMCEGCGVRLASDEHHKEHKQMGGRHGAAKVYIERAENKINLCRVCHAAGHLLRVSEGSFSCRVCPRRAKCYYGAYLCGLPYSHLTPEW